jgi:ATP-dependent exoDNAse (exonuclease V) alpha subunit
LQGTEAVVLPGLPPIARASAFTTSARATLWNTAEEAGKRRNSLLAREVFVLLPPELTATQRAELVRGFAKELANRYHNAVDITIHAPRPGADPRHHHAHLLLTPRELTPNGFGQRTALELSGTERRARGLEPSKNDYLEIRQRWAEVTNQALAKAGLETRVDHRSYEKQGLNREPVPVIPQKIYYAEKKSGMNTRAGDDIRARHHERVEARAKGSDELARVVERQTRESRTRAIERTESKTGPAPRSLVRLSSDDRRRLRHRPFCSSAQQTGSLA